ncbi:MAG: LytTR family DNA-binding domain-containing protein [Pseudomonadota bacterium]
MRFAIVRNDAVGIAVAGIAAALVYAAYCQLHGLLDSEAIPMGVSLGWGVSVGLPSGLFGWLIWRERALLAAFVDRGPMHRMSISIGIFLTTLIIGSMFHVVAPGGDYRADFAAQILARMFDLLPVAVAVAALITTLLLRVRAKGDDNVTEPVSDIRWMTFPEAPRLKLRVDDICTIRSAANYCEVHTADRVHLVRAPLKLMAERLAPRGFVRVHRTAVVNLARLQSVTMASSGRTSVVHLDNGDHIKIGAAFADALDDLLVQKKS